jgi:hydrogenase maturation protease
VTSTDPQHIMIMGIGCNLYADEGFGVHVIETLRCRYRFPKTVTLIDGSVLGTSLLGVVSQPDHLIIVDAMRRNGQPGERYRLEEDAVSARIEDPLAHYQSEMLDAITMCQALEKVPRTVFIGVEPADIESCSLELTPQVREQMDAVIDMVLAELDRLGIDYAPGETPEEECQYPI